MQKIHISIFIIQHMHIKYYIDKEIQNRETREC